MKDLFKLKKLESLATSDSFKKRICDVKNVSQGAICVASGPGSVANRERYIVAYRFVFLAIMAATFICTHTPKKLRITYNKRERESLGITSHLVHVYTLCVVSCGTCG